MTENDFKEGMTVWLNEGSVPMSLKLKTPNNMWRCTWFIGANVKEWDFLPSQLTNEAPKGASVKDESDPF